MHMESTALLCPNTFRKLEIADRNKIVAKWLNEVEPVFVVDEITTWRTPANKRHLPKPARLQPSRHLRKYRRSSSLHRNYLFRRKSTFPKKVDQDGAKVSLKKDILSNSEEDDNRIGSCLLTE
jgi:hypothetical protein